MAHEVLQRRNTGVATRPIGDMRVGGNCERRALPAPATQVAGSAAAERRRALLAATAQGHGAL